MSPLSEAKGNMGETEKTGERIVSIDTGKTRSYVVVEENGNVVKEGYVDTSSEGSGDVLPSEDSTMMMIETADSVEKRL